MSTLLTYARALWITQPVRVITIATSLLVFAAARAGVIVSEQDISSALLLVLPIILGGEAARTQVSPAAPFVGIPSDHLLPDPPPDDPLDSA